MPPCTDNPIDEVNSDGQGDSVTEYIDYCPWREEPCREGPGPVIISVGGEVFPVDDIGSTNSWLGRILTLALGCGLAVAVISQWILRRRAT